MMYKVIVLGPQRSGTNYLQFLLKRNFYHVKIIYEQFIDTDGVNKHEYIWKHTAYPDRDKLLSKNVIHIGIIKNPYKWVESLERYSADLTDNFGNWKKPMPDYKPAREQFYVEDKNGKKVDVEHAIKLYNKFYNNWMTQDKVTFSVIKYEDLLDDKTDAYKQINHKTGLRIKSKPWADTDQVDQSELFTKERKNYYLNDSQTTLTDFQKEVIKNTVDQNLLRKFSYRLL